MSTAEELKTRHTARLRNFGLSLPEELANGAALLQEHVSTEELERWAETGVAMANHALRSWETAEEFFRTSHRVAPVVSFAELMDWAAVATSLADRSPVMAAAFVRATPGALEQLPAGELDPWARQGERLCRGNWKSIALSSLFFDASPRLLGSLSLTHLGELAEVLDALTDRSYELATTCLEGAGDIFEALPPEDHRPFLDFARVITRASWADIRLYFERGPGLLLPIEAEQRRHFLALAGRVTADEGRRGFPLFHDAAAALGELQTYEHARLLQFAGQLAAGSPIAAMEYLKSAPFVINRLTPDQMQRWAEAGANVLQDEENVEGAEAYFRLESTRAEEMLAELSARVELPRVSGTLRLYSKALTGEEISVRSTEDLVDRGIGWVTESTGTTEGTAIYLPPFIGTFDAQEDNFQVYKVFATHQAGRIEFGSFGFRFGPDGEHIPSTMRAREQRLNGDGPPSASTPMERFYDLFPNRPMISGLFTVAEDTRVDAWVAREYSGIRGALRRLQSFEAERRPDVREMPLRRAFAENLLRASLGRPELIRWPRELHPLMAEGLAALAVTERAGATTQDSAEVAATLYDLAERIPNVAGAPTGAGGEWEALGEQPADDAAGLPGADEAGGDPSGEEGMEFEAPPQPEFRGDFKPELVQLMVRLRLQEDGDPEGEFVPISPEMLQELLEKSAEIEISSWAEGDIGITLGQFLSSIEDLTPTSTSETEVEMQPGEQRAGAPEPEPEEGDLAVQVDWFYYDEWDFRASDYRPRWCRVGERPAEEGELDYYEEILRKHHGLVLETRRQFELLRPEAFRKIKRLEDGDEIDLDRAIEFLVDKRAGVGPLAQIYWRRNKVERDVAVAFLLDMSASTDEEIDKERRDYDHDDEFDDDPRKYFQWLAQRRAQQTVDPPKRIIDLEKESTVLIVEALEAIGDAYGIYGFSGYGRENVEFYVIKDLEESFDDRVRRRVDKIDPIRSTRMGPAIRHTLHKLEEYDAKVKLLIMVSDGRPQDHGYGRDRTEKEYAVHDTKEALLEAKRAGVTPFLLTVDKEGHDYLGQMCDDIGYEVVADIESLPRRLTTLYRALAVE